jgi:selenocysteine lyase/cysteine desulfurase
LTSSDHFSIPIPVKNYPKEEFDNFFIVVIPYASGLALPNPDETIATCRREADPEGTESIWVNEFKQHTTVEVVTPAEKDLSCAIASFRIRNKNTADIANYLLKQHRIFTVDRSLGKDGCIRVTPSVYNSADDVKKLVTAIKSYTEQ